MGQDLYDQEYECSWQSVTAASIFLLRNGQRLTATNEAVEELTLAVAQGALTTDQIAAWFVQPTVRAE